MRTALHFTNMVESKVIPKRQKLPKLVGNFIRQRREALRISQRALGQLFDPAVTTQFISNVERGVTPLPPSHVPTLAKALRISEAEIMAVLEQEYAQRLSGRLGKAPSALETPEIATKIAVLPEDVESMKKLYEAFKKADADTRRAFLTAAENILKFSSKASSNDENTPI